MPLRSEPHRWREPLRVWLLVLATVFATEAVVMVLLPTLLPAEPPRLLAAGVDAILLTAVLAPVLWRLLLRPLREANRVRSDFLAHLFASIEADRRQTAHDLHDGVDQSLTLLVSGLRSAATHRADDFVLRCETLSQLAKQALLDVKRLALGLRPSLLDDLGLAPALERLVADVRESHHIEITSDVAAVAGVRLSADVETALFRIAQEALANVVAHARATHASLAIRSVPTGLALEIADDGVGISPASRRRTPGHLGLTGMRERATLLGGELVIHSEPGRGTRVCVRLPLHGGAP